MNKFWLELREPGKVPQRKGPFDVCRTAATLREFMSARPSAFITVVTVDEFGTPDFEDGPEALACADFRSASTARRHIASTRKAFAEAPERAWPERAT